MSAAVLLPGAVPSDSQDRGVLVRDHDIETPFTPRSRKGVLFSPHVQHSEKESEYASPPATDEAAETAAQGDRDLEAGHAEPLLPPTELVTDERQQAWKAGAKHQEHIEKLAIDSTDEVYVPLKMARRRVQECAEERDAMKAMHEQLIRDLNAEWEAINVETKEYYDGVIVQLRTDMEKSLRLSKQKLVAALNETAKYKRRQEEIDMEQARLLKRLSDQDKGLKTNARRAQLDSRKSAHKLAAATARAEKTAAEAERAKKHAAGISRELDAAEAKLNAASIATESTSSATDAEVTLQSEGVQSENDREHLLAEIERLRQELSESKSLAARAQKVAADADQAKIAAELEATKLQEEQMLNESAAGMAASPATKTQPRDETKESPSTDQQQMVRGTVGNVPSSEDVKFLQDKLAEQLRQNTEQKQKIEEQRQQLESLQHGATSPMLPAAPSAAAAQGKAEAAAAAVEAAELKLAVIQAKLESAEANMKANTADPDAADEDERDRLLSEIERLQKELKKAQARAAVKAEEALKAEEEAKLQAEKPITVRPQAPAALYKMQMALLRARLNVQLKTAQLAQENIEAASAAVEQQQQSRASDVAAAEKAVADCKDEGQMFEELQALGAAQGDAEQLKKHASELESQRNSLLQEKEMLEKVLKEAKQAEATASEAKESSASREKALRAELEQLHGFVESSADAMNRQKELLQAARDQLVIDKSEAEAELILAERTVNKPPPGRKPSEKKKDKQRMQMLKQKVDSLATSVASTEQGLAWMSQSSAEQEDAVSANSEALKVMQSTTQDAATISELERKNAALAESKNELKEQLAELKEELVIAQGSRSDKGGGTRSGGSGDRSAQLKAEKAAKLAEQQIKTLNTKVSRLEDQLRIEKEKAAVASATSDKAGSREAERKFAKEIKDLEKKLTDKKKTDERNTKLLDKLKADLAAKNEAFEELQQEVKKLRVAGSGADKELAELRAVAEKAAATADAKAAVESELAGLKADFHALEKSYKDQVTLRKKYYNIIEDMKGKIRVYARCRPMAQYEIEKQCKPSVSFPDEYTVDIQMGNGKGTRSFAYDCAFTPDSTQEETYEETSTLIQSALDGYNVCVFAYGQTGSGKTFTMIGSESMPGLLPRAMIDIYKRKEELADDYTINVKTYMLELYNDQILDLLGTHKKSSGGGKQDGLVVKKDKNGMVFCPGSTVVDCPTLELLQECWKKGESSRHVGFTKMNAGSSRSHLIISILIESIDLKTGNKSVGKLSLVDLAGSERAGKTGATADRLKEAQSINKSLSALGDVISALSAGAEFIPYRNNKLTMLMSDSLGGNAKTLMYVNISPADYNTDETLTSLAYAARVKMITNDANKNQESKEVARLKEQIKALQAGRTVADETTDI